MTILFVCLALLLALGVAERVAIGRARAAVPIRIHVNGTRGKSTVTRLVAAALGEAGIRTVAKVTGTEPRLILPDGSEEPVVRFAPANIREQVWLLRRARRAGARAVVVECMAIRPDLQWVTERDMVRATIGVITNVRLDHTEVMGRSLERIAESLAGSIPPNAVLVTGEVRLAPLFASRCAALGTRLVAGKQSGAHFLADAGKQSGADFRHFPAPLDEDVLIALAVTREVGVADDVALTGMAKAIPDPGAAASGVAVLADREVEWLDATAANDPESLDLLVAGLKPCLAVYNHRQDRPDRLRVFAEWSATLRRSPRIVVTGERPSVTLMRAVRRALPSAEVRFVRSQDLRSHLVATLSEIASDATPAVVFCGNTRGFMRPFGDQRPTTPTNDQRPGPTTND